MTDSKKKSNDELPAVVVKKHRWGISAVWVVPIVAALVAGYLVYQGVTQFGPEITIEFKDGTGLKNGQTVILYRGVKVGQVQSTELNRDHKSVLVRARMQRFAGSLAREGSIFWIVRPEVGVGNISGLSTVISGSHIEVSPGEGKPTFEFVGQEGTPATLDPNGLKIILLTNRLGSVQTNSPVYYRGVQVGTVEGTTLSSNATTAEIHVLIKERYVKLVQGGSKFWNASGTDVRFGLFRGLEINVQSLKSLLAGGISFATPPESRMKTLKDGSVFRLYDDPRKEWLQWRPEIPIAPES